MKFISLIGENGVTFSFSVKEDVEKILLSIFGLVLGSVMCIIVNIGFWFFGL